MDASATRAQTIKHAGIQDPAMTNAISSALRAVTVVSIAALGTAGLWAAIQADEAPVAAAAGAPARVVQTEVVAGASTRRLVAFDGVVQAVRHTVVAAQVSGAIVSLEVKPGDLVRAGQVLARLDARAAEQTAAAGAAQARAAHAAMDAAQREYERQKQLLEKKFISQAAFDRAEERIKSAQAETAAQLASAGAARTQSDFHVIRAPYAGVVADVPVVLGDMAMPGRPLVAIYDPAALRVSVSVPLSAAVGLRSDAGPVAEVPGIGPDRIEPVRVQLVPAVDPSTHTQELRLDLPPAAAHARPGMFARVWIPAANLGEDRVFVPARSVLRRAELTAVYVVDPMGKPLLRQVRLGRAEGERVEVLSGVSVNERVAVDPFAAARVR